MTFHSLFYSFSPSSSSPSSSAFSSALASSASSKHCVLVLSLLLFHWLAFFSVFYFINERFFFIVFSNAYFITTFFCDDTNTVSCSQLANNTKRTEQKKVNILQLDLHFCLMFFKRNQNYNFLKHETQHVNVIINESIKKYFLTYLSLTIKPPLFSLLS